jgi:predicted adenine nucleotide alpha hydrolase (AANH) superfamily ATPase
MVPFDNKDYKKVIELWDKHKIDSVDASRFFYAPSLYHLKRYDEALKEFQRIYKKLGYPSHKKEVQDWIEKCKDKLSQQ